tara:strand:- start:11991 stop:13805 length:1815 start_codon:yes stop_codon:yes gene_type:complete
MAQIKPAPMESLDGFLRRLAEAELWSDVSDLLGGIGARYGRGLIEGAADIEAQLDLERGTLRDIIPSADPPEPRLNWRFERHHSAPVCPECISAGRPHHQAWRHVFVTCCVEHELTLVDSCPMCLEHFQPGRGGYDSCSCGCPLDRLDRRSATDRELAIAALVGGLMHPARAHLPPSLSFRTPSDIGGFLHFLISSQANTVTGKHGKLPFPRTIKESRHYLEPAQALLCAWPEAFAENVKARLDLGDITSSSAPARLGKWYQRLKQFSDTSYLDFHNVLQEVVLRHFDGTYVGGATKRGVERDWISAAEAARIIGIRPDRIVDAVAKGVLDGQQYHRGFDHRQTMIKRSEMQDILHNRSQFYDKSTTRDFLGVSRKQLEILIGAGFLGDCTPSKQPHFVEGNFDADVLALMVEVIAGNAAGTSKTVVAFRELNMRFTTDLEGMTEVLRLIRSGLLRPLLGSTSGKLADFHFDRDAVQQVLQDIRRGPGLTAQEVSKLTGWKEQCIAHWCDLGLLEHEKFDHGRGVGRVIRQDALVKFQSAYITTSALAKESSTSPRKLLQALAKRGISTVGALKEGNAWRGHLVSTGALGKLVICPAPLAIHDQ